MSKNKLKNSIWFILFEGLKIYFSNIDKFLLYMLFPVFGQILGIAFAMGLSISLMQTVVEKTDSTLMALVYVILLAVPGLLIFTKAFWNYMVASYLCKRLHRKEVLYDRRCCYDRKSL